VAFCTDGVVLREETPLRRAATRSAVAGTLLILFCALLSGCATIGRQFPVDAVADIQIGETTREQIRAMFGPPWRTGIEDGRQTWTYARYRYALFSAAETEDLIVRFDAQGVVVSYAFNTTRTDEAKREK
jgi:outer membrane protein assembly factor BamE (lipoprotein component of BamABCDE complex)